MPISIMSGSFLPSLWSSNSHSLLGSRSRHCYAIMWVSPGPNLPRSALDRSHIHTVEDFARYFNCRPDRLGPRHIREYQAVLFQKRNIADAFRGRGEVTCIANQHISSQTVLSW